MAWQPSLPGDDTKLRTSQGYVRGNWLALETGGVPFDMLKLENQGGDPTRESGFGWVYAKTVASYRELYYEDDRNAASVIQLTNNGGIGATTQILYGSAVITTGTYQNTQNSFCSAWARVDSSGSLTAGYNVSSTSKSSTGTYVVNFSPVLSSTNYCIVATPRDTASPTHNRVAMVTGQAVGSCTIRIQRINQGSNDFEDTSFYIAVFGGR